MEELEHSSAVELIQDRLADLQARKIQLQEQLEKDLLVVLMPIDTSIRELRGLLGQLGASEDESVPQYNLVKRSNTPTPQTFAPIPAAAAVPQPSQVFQPVAKRSPPPKEMPAPASVMGPAPVQAAQRKLDHKVPAVLSPATGAAIQTNNAILRRARRGNGQG